MFKWVLFLWPFVATGMLWLSDPASLSNLDYSVEGIGRLSLLETKWAYSYIHLFAFVPVFLLSFDTRVRYCAYWRTLFPAIGIMAVLFIVWDAYFGYAGVWGFNDVYTTGLRWLGLPWEEWMFFITVPFASFFIYACLNTYFPTDPLKVYDKWISLGLVSVLLLSALWYLDRLYTASTFILTGGLLLYNYIYIPNTYRTLFFRAYLIILIPFLLCNGILTGVVTQGPIVVYNPQEFMGLRITTIPLEDSAYGFLLLLGVVSFQEFFKKITKRFA